MKHMLFSGIDTQRSEEDFYTIKPVQEKWKNDFYFLSNDMFINKLENGVNLRNVLFMGIANPHFFHVLSTVIQKKISIQRIVAIDCNYRQLIHFDRIRQLILSSKNRIAFIENLFKVKINDEGRNILENFNPYDRFYVNGALESAPHYDIEKELWKHILFDEKQFYQEYGIKAEAVEAGIKVESEVVGGIDTYFCSILSGDQSSYGFWTFTLGYGSGYLFDEETFAALQQCIKEIPIYQIYADISEVFDKIAHSNKYTPILFWASNLFNTFFSKKFPILDELYDQIAKLGTQVPPNRPELDIILLQDERTARSVENGIDNLPNHDRIWSIHAKSFNKVSRYIKGKNSIELVSVSDWVKNDHGESKLPNTEYLMVDDFISLNETNKFDTIFAHILVGHGMQKETFKALMEKAQSLTDNLIVLEHNAESDDFSDGVGLTLPELRELVGLETYLDYCPGKNCDNRNILCVYQK